MAKRPAKPATTESLEAQLWKAADKLRKNIDAAEYKHVVLGLVFLRYISEAFTAKFAELAAEEYADPEDRDEYQAENIFFVPPAARWANIQSQAKQPTIGRELDHAMEAIEGENPSLKNVLPKVYARQNLDATVLGELIDLISNVSIAVAQARSDEASPSNGRVPWKARL